MKIIVLNGSPKGDLSVTMQYVHFIQKKFPIHNLEILNISQRINAIEKNEDAFQGIIDRIRSSDALLWAFPVYFLLVPSQYKRFIELISERGACDVFIGKYGASLSTSVHFHDHIAHNYINAICDDLGMRFTGYFSADMYDLLNERKKKQLILFAQHFFHAIENKIPTCRNFTPVSHSEFDYFPGDVYKKIDTGENKVLVLTDSFERKTNLGLMISRFVEAFTGNIEVIDLNQVYIKGGCQGCIQCGYENSCLYGDNDDYIEFFNTKLKSANILILAGLIKDRYLSSRWKLFFDRSFFNNHMPAMRGKQIGFIISGPLRQSPDLKQALKAFYEVQETNLVDFVTDECCESENIDDLLQGLAEKIVRCANDRYIQPNSFLGVGGKKVLRDDIYGRLRFPFWADHRFFKMNKMYDFPQKNYKSRIKNTALLLMTRIPFIRKEIYTKRMKEEMVKPLQKVLERE